MNRFDSIKIYDFSMSNKQYKIKRKMGVLIPEWQHCGITL